VQVAAHLIEIRTAGSVQHIADRLLLPEAGMRSISITQGRSDEVGKKGAEL
jgi:hypothetical protein